MCDWLAKWIIMLRFMDLWWPRVFRRSNVGLVNIVILGHEHDFEKHSCSLKYLLCFCYIISVPLKAGRGISAETCGLNDVFPPDDLGSSVHPIYYIHTTHYSHILTN